MRWIVELQLFDYELKSKPPTLQKLVDCLANVPPFADEPENVTHDLFCIELSREWHGKSYIIVATDYLTKWSEARVVRSDDAHTTTTFLIDHVICHFGALAELVSDRGTHFLYDVLEDLTSYFNIRHDKTTPYKPSTNGQVETTNKTLATILRKIVDVNKRDWDEKLLAAVWAYNITFKEATGFTPFSLVYGQECCCL
ncbi:hypothetical protein L7F22_036291 [Adiantum nelumboides]|nr:hypothetical protein [Adiantum nelumboides]